MTRPTRPKHGAMPEVIERKQDLSDRMLKEAHQLLKEAKKTDAWKLKHGWKFVITCAMPFTQTLMPKEKAKNYPKFVHA